MILYQHLAEHAKFQADKTAIDYEGKQLSYHQFHCLVDQCAEYFDRSGLKEGDRVAILALNHPDWFIALFAAERLGMLLVPLNWRLSVDELHFAVEDSAPTLLLHDKNYASVAQQLKRTTPDLVLKLIGHSDFPPATNSLPDQAKKPRPSPFAGGAQAHSRDLLIVYTSGTTGRPKGAVLSNAALLCSAKMSKHMLDLQKKDRVLNVLPLFHVGGLNIQPLPALLFGATLYLQPRFDPETTLASIEQDRISLLTVVPALLYALIDFNNWPSANLASVRAVSIGSTDVPVSLLEILNKRQIPVLQIYGATETSPVAIYQCIKQPTILGSIGQVGIHCEVRLVNAEGRTVGNGESGEIQVKGDNILTRYWNNEEATQRSIKDGWFATGDVAHQDANNNFWFDDRLKHVVISGGENIYPAELERLIRLVPGVEDVAVVGKPHDRWGEVPVAVVITQNELSSATVMEACSSLAKFKHPSEVIFVEEFPRNALGKIQVQQLKTEIQN